VRRKLTTASSGEGRAVPRPPGMPSISTGCGSPVDRNATGRDPLRRRTRRSDVEAKQGALIEVPACTSGVKRARCSRGGMSVSGPSRGGSAGTLTFRWTIRDRLRISPVATRPDRLVRLSGALGWGGAGRASDGQGPQKEATNACPIAARACYLAFCA
jgi:hypothetical protein